MRVTSETEFEPLHSFSPNSSASFSDKHLIMEEDDSSASSTVDDLEQNSLPKNVSDQTSSAYEGRIVEEPRVVVHTISEADILEDGYSWKKYGQKELMGYPNPRTHS
ncbi:WRKY DNA-binding protein 33 [Prunus dulcis]|uniref:WRKY DNA-binding protein 33 n=1 Tax=Prunus dulcis TaxID=3755 RepID=A0A4Y1RGV2_PRUDU|nr:WRKY DNA-binding protein 33 [Prunus dulcis]